jgi:hypothetical protein
VIRHVPTAALACSLVSLAACTDLGSTELFRHPVPQPFTITSQEPAPDATDVPLDAPVSFTVSDLPDPDSVDRLTFALTSGGLLFTGGFRVDLIDRRISYIPARELPPHLLLRVNVGTGVTSLDGRPLEPAAEWSFTTGTTMGGAPSPPPLVSLAEVQPLLTARCAGCHAGGGALLGLDLGTAQASHDSLVGRPSEERPLLYRVAAGDSSRSYLLRKLLGAPTIVGDPMPPADALTTDELRRIAAWIDGGARP